MTHNLAFDFLVDKETNTITVKREFAAELPLVWDAFTTSEILDQWWGPKPWKARTKTMDFREGGRWHYAMVSPEGEEHWGLVEYETIQPREKFTRRDTFTDAAGNINPNMPRSKWEITFTDKGAVTLVESHVTYQDSAHLEMILQMGFKGGLTMCMEQLDELLTSLKK